MHIFLDRLIKALKVVIYSYLAAVLALNIFGIEMILGFFIPEISISSDKEGELKVILDKDILKFTFIAVVLEAVDNIIAMAQPIKN